MNIEYLKDNGIDIAVVSGDEMAKKPDSVGIDSAEELVRSGAEHAFLKWKDRYPNVCPVHLCALEGAGRNVEFNSLLEFSAAFLPSPPVSPYKADKALS